MIPVSVSWHRTSVRNSANVAQTVSTTFGPIFVSPLKHRDHVFVGVHRVTLLVSDRQLLKGSIIFIQTLQKGQTLLSSKTGVICKILTELWPFFTYILAKLPINNF